MQTQRSVISNTFRGLPALVFLCALMLAFAAPAFAQQPQVSVGSDNTIVLKSDGTLWAWGSNSAGQLGIGNTTDQHSPVQVGSEPIWSALTAGTTSDTTHTVAIKSGGTLWAWGNNGNGQLGIGNATAQYSPVQVGITNVVSAAQGGYYTAAVKSDGTLWTWGSNDYGQLGIGNTTEQHLPTQVGISNVESVAAGNHTLALKDDGTLWAWGANWAGMLGIGNTTEQHLPTQVGISNVVALAAGETHSVALKSDGSLWAWGFNGSGQLGIGNVTTQYSPVQVGTDNDWDSVIAGRYHTVAIKSDGTLWAWGNNGNGQLGIGNIIDKHSPVQVGSDNKWISVAASSEHTVGLKSDGTVWTWGRNYYGQLGIGNDTGPELCGGSTPCSTTPIEVMQAGESSGVWVAVATGWNTSGAVNTDGTLWMWGNNVLAQLGIGNTIEQHSPVRVGTEPTWSALAIASTGSSLGMKSDGSVWTWGLNTRGELGIGNFTGPEVCQYGACSTSPLKVGLSNNAVSIAAGSMHKLVVKSDGSLWGWGSNWDGELGIGNNTGPEVCGGIPCSTYPIPIGISNVLDVTAGGHGQSIALKSDGSLWAWGDNTYGQLGLGNTTDQYSPVRVGTDSNWSSVAAGDTHTMAIKNGTLWAWGDNSYGKLGIGNGTAYSWPVQVGTDEDWVEVAAGDNHTLAIKSNGTLWAWGNNNHGQLGIGNATSMSTSPVQVGIYNVVSVAAGNNHSLAVTSDGSLWAWGYNYDGQVGDGTTADRYYPVLISSGAGDDAAPSTTASPAGGSYNFQQSVTLTCDDGTGFGCDTTYFCLGNACSPSTIYNASTSPIGITNSTELRFFSTDIVGNAEAVKTETYIVNGTDYAPPVTSATVPGGIYNGTQSVTLTCDDGGGSGCETTYYCLGAGCYPAAIYNGAIDVTLTTYLRFRSRDLAGNVELVRTEIYAKGAAVISQLAAGEFNTLALKTDGTVWAWGGNSDGQLGDGTITKATSPIQSAIANVIAISSGGFHSLAVREDEALWSWGYGVWDQLGIGNATTKHSPTQATIGNVLSIAAGEKHSVGLRSDGTLWGWGRNAEGQIGIGTATTSIQYPSQVGSDNDWVSVEAGGMFTVGLKSDGTLWTWGANYVGQLGIGNSTGPVQGGTQGSFYSPSPYLVGISNVVYSSAGYSHTMALRSDGTLWAWGSNQAGQLGIGNSTGPETCGISSSACSTWPVQVGTFTDWATVSTGGGHTVAIRSDGTLWAWGSNGYGQLGDGTSTDRYSPVQIGSDTDWVAVAAGGSHSVALKSDGSLWAWGDNTYGQLGDGTTTSRYTPIRVYGGAADAAPPTGSMLISADDFYATSEIVTLNLTCTDAGSGCSDVRFSNDGVSFSNSVAFSNSASWTLSAGDGTKTVYAQFKDNSGNWSGVYSDTIELDATLPVTSASPVGGLYSLPQSVTLSCDDGSGSGCDTTYYCLGAGCNPASIYNGAIDVAPTKFLRFYSNDLAGNNENIQTEVYTQSYNLTVSTQGTGLGNVISMSGIGGIDEYTVLALHNDGTDGSKTFTDESGIVNAVAASGGAQVDTAQSKFGGASAYLDGTGDYLAAADSDAWDCTASDCTVDMWFRLGAMPSSLVGTLIGQSNASSDGNWFVYVYNTGKIAIGKNGINELATAAPEVTAGVWYHLAVVKSGSTTKIYLDGVEKASGTTDVWNSAAAELRLGAVSATKYRINGWIDEVRFSKGIARWTSDFTPPSLPYSTYVGSSISCGDGTIGDCSEDYAEGTNITLSATASDGSTFGGWSGIGSGCVSSSTTPCSFDITTNTSVTATFDSTGPSADVGVGVTASQNPVAAGQAFTYQIAVDNLGPDTATGVTLTDTLPNGAVVIGLDTSHGTCSESGGTVTCNLGDIPYLVSPNVEITVIQQLPGLRDNTASVTSTSDDTNPANDSYTINVMGYPSVFTDVDFDGNGVKDVAIFRPSVGKWFTNNIDGTNFQQLQFGQSGDIPLPADYNGDGKTDVAIFRPSAGKWFFTDMTQSFFNSITFGMDGDIPVPGDYDGVAGDEVAIFRPSAGKWFLTDMTLSFFNSAQFGMDGDIPVPGHYTGASAMDVAIYRPSVGKWFVSDMNLSFLKSVQFGAPGDVLVPGDYYDLYTGDEIAIYRPSAGKWFFTDEDQSFFNALQFGSAGDIPLTGDFNSTTVGEEIALYRPSVGKWFVSDETLSFFNAVQFGMPGDIPLSGDYNGSGQSDIVIVRPSVGKWFFTDRTQSYFKSLSFFAAGDAPF